MSHKTQSGFSSKPLLTAIIVVLVMYGLAACFQWPQTATQEIVKSQHHATDQSTTDSSASHSTANHSTDHPATDQPEAAGKPEDQDENINTPEQMASRNHPPYWMALPFVLLLGAIAFFPLAPGLSHWWESNLHRFYVAAALGILTLLYYAALYHAPIHAHWPAHHVVDVTSGGNWRLMGAIFANAIFSEYIPFIVLLFSLYVISGGIRIEGDLPAHPLVNTAFLAIGGILASFIGTTGAAMILIRPLLETNRERKHVKHTVIFFLFIVCNCGGCLLPLGDPPLFLGYLKGVPFLWTLVLWKQWLFVNGILLVIYLLWDRLWCYPHETTADVARDEKRVHRLKILGLWPNGALLVGVVLAIGLLSPSKPMPGTDWHAWLYLREAIQLGLVGLSIWLGSPSIRVANRFQYGPMIEVAVLFFGIFLCMQPPLQILAVQGPRLGLTAPWQYFWATGSLSSMLDNSPTYVVFFETAKSLIESGGVSSTSPGIVAGVSEPLLVAISLGAVFMGAMTYIGNGPNFMVKAIAEKSGVPMPSFFGFLLYSVCILVPLFLLTTFLFL
jgi:Na+/H+ antiporter NhaD/arsenite permease-like protein